MVQRTGGAIVVGTILLLAGCTPTTAPDGVLRATSSVSEGASPAEDVASSAADLIAENVVRDELGGAPVAWELAAIRPDGLEIAVVVEPNCGLDLVASVKEDGDQVVVALADSSMEQVDGCTSSLGFPEVHRVHLQAPLGQRSLRGCRVGVGDLPCRESVAEDFVGVLVPRFDDAVAEPTANGTVIRDATSGDARGRPVDLGVGWPTRRGDTLIGRTQQGEFVGVELATGAVVWRGFREEWGSNAVAFAEAVAVVQDRVVFDVVHGINLSDGSPAWTVDLDVEIGMLIAGGDRVSVAVTIRPEVPGVVVLDAGTGEVLDIQESVQLASDLVLRPQEGVTATLAGSTVLTAENRRIDLMRQADQNPAAAAAVVVSTPTDVRAYSVDGDVVWWRPRPRDASLLP